MRNIYALMTFLSYENCTMSASDQRSLHYHLFLIVGF